MKKENNQKKYAQLKISPLEDSQVEIEAEITAEHFETYRLRATKKLLAEAEIPGFRKGNAPEHIVLQHYGNAKILEHAAQDVIDEEYANIISDNAIKAIGSPHVTITKIAEGNPLGFKIKTAVFPEVTLPDYVSIAQEKTKAPEEPTAVEQKEVDEVLKQLQSSKKNHTNQHAHAHDHVHDHALSHANEKNTVDLPILDDTFAQSIGPFKTLTELTEKIRENLGAEKKVRAKEKRRIAIIEALVEKTPITVPELLIESELQKMIAQFKDDIARTGLTYETYLSHIKKTEEDVRKECRDTAIKRAKTQLILGKIALEKKIELDEDVVKKEIDHVISHHKDADRFQVRMFIENMLTNEKVLKFLEETK